MTTAALSQDCVAIGWSKGDEGLQQQQQQQDGTNLNLESCQATEGHMSLVQGASQQQEQPPVGSSIENPGPVGNEISIDQAELWIKACRELRLSQEKSLQKTLLTQVNVRAAGEDCTFWTLKGNMLASLLLGTATMARYLLPTAPWKQLCSTYHSHHHHHHHHQSLNNTLTLPHDSSIALQILPLAPTLFLSGIQFFTALRTYWTLQQIEQQTQLQRTMTRRTKLLTTQLSLREQRLIYLLHQIKATHLPNASLPSSTLSSSLSSPSSSLVSNPGSLGQSRPQGSVGGSERPRRSRVAPCRTGDDGSVGDRQPSEEIRQHGLNEAAWAMEPNLRLLNLGRLLRDPAERSRVLRRELEALREDLVFFRGE
ncbi:hypothetical protein BC939DRAFT_502823 [Gamsiella multidivaricata]|uniref:uncharacterized protein n=1 Tax=Gamsiella multidivaricata TaxID=101098 RepID=UPI00221F7EBF|nr:uncharacterized protein BC939DRAFT_502823 [Gamsiella multidivaricata]KAI7824405.1 hypothetical protein BC939DRAFT_502823 [Gamsiella multidivaricata]